MLDAVVECLVKRCNTVGTYILRFIMFSVDAILLAASLFVLVFIPAYGIIICLFIGIGWFVSWLVVRYTKVEYEYSYFEDKTKNQLLNMIWELQKAYQKLKEKRK